MTFDQVALLARAACFSTSGDASLLRIHVTKLARSIFGGQATPLHFLKIDLQYADHCELVWHGVGSRAVQKTYGCCSNSNAIRSMYLSSMGAIMELMLVTDGP